MTAKNPSRAMRFITTLMCQDTPWSVMREAIFLMAQANQIQLSAEPKGSWSQDQEDLFALVSIRTLGTHSVAFPIHWGMSSQEYVTQSSSWVSDPICVDDMMSWFGAPSLCAPQKLLGNRSFVHCALDVLVSAKDEPLLAGLQAWASRLPWSELEQWSPKSSRRMDHGHSLMEVLLFDAKSHTTTSYSHRKAQSDAVMETVLSSGGKLTGAMSRSKTPLAAHISTPMQWDAYIKQGGDADVLISQHDHAHSTSLPLWQHLVENVPSVSEHVSQWATQARADVFGAAQEKAYWHKLNQAVRYGGVNVDMLRSSLKAHPEWPSLRDEHGRSPMMRVVDTHPSAFKLFSAKKYTADVIARDKLGRSLVHHTLASTRGQSLSSDLARFLVGHPALFAPTPSGIGLLSLIGPSCVEPKDINAFKILLKNTPASDWFSCASPQDTDVLVQMYLDAMTNKNAVVLALRAMAEQYASTVSDPNVMGVVRPTNRFDAHHRRPVGAWRHVARFDRTPGGALETHDRFRNVGARCGPLHGKRP